MKRPAAGLFGCVVLLLLLTAAGIASIPTLQTGTWHSMGLMGAARSGAAAVLLKDHRVLIAGGDDGTGAVTSVEVFNADGSFSAVSAMGAARAKHVAVALADGRVLVAGGEGAGGGTTNSAEIYDPTYDSWTTIAGGMIEARSKASVSLLKDGRVLIAGGQNGSAPSSTAEIFDPGTGNFSFAGTLSSPRMGLASATLADGRVLITGGSNRSVAVATTDVFDPTTNTVSAGPAMTSPREGHTTTSLLDGRVLVAGGNNGSADLASAEVFDPAVGGFAVVSSSLAAPRRNHAAILLRNNNALLIVGGTSAGSEVATAEMFVPWTDTFAATGSPSVARQQAAASTLSQDGLLLMAGGASAGAPVGSAELYGFATVKTDAADYAPGSVVTITGTGWRPGESVTLTLVESPLVDTHPVMTALADGQGNITNSDFIPDQYDLNIRFYLTAVGSQSGYQAQNTFTDANKPTSTITFPANNGSYNAAGWSGTISGTGSFDSGSTGRVIKVSIKRNGTNRYWNGTSFGSASEVFFSASGTTAWTLAFPFVNFPPNESYTVHSQASDSNGTEPGTTNATFTIDTAAPAPPSTPSLASTSDSGTSQTDAITNIASNLKFNGTAEANSTVNVFLDGSGTSAGTGTATNGGNWNNVNVAAALSEGAHTITANATDKAGNTSTLSPSLSFTIDLTAPTTTITSNPSNPSNSTSASFAFTGNDPVSGGVSSGVDRFLCKLDAGAFAPCTSPKAYSGLVAGPHTFQVEAVDVAGNTGPGTSFPWSIVLDSTPPAVTVTFASPVFGTNGWFNGQDTVPVVGSVTATDPSSVTSITCTDSAGGLTQGALTGGGTTSASRSLSVSGDGTHNISCSATDGASNAGAAAGSTNTATLKIDTQAPTGVSGSANRAADHNGWFTSAVTINFSGTETMSGPAVCTSTVYSGPDNAAASVSGHCTDQAGNVSANVVFNFKFDSTPPTAVALSVTTGTPGSNGWYTSDVTVHTSGTETVSGPVVCTADQSQTAETTGQLFNGSCTNDAGLSASAAPITIKLDKTGPTATLAVTSGALGDNGWYTSDVTVHASGSDNISSPVSCSSDQVISSETTGTPVNGSCTNDAGLSTNAAALNIKLDKTAPVVALSVAAGTAGAHGWYTSDVTVHTSGTDGISGIASCDGDQFQTTETAGASFNGSCKNGAGLTGNASPLSVKLDKTGPTATLAVSSGTLGDGGWYVSDVTVQTTGNDPISNPTTCTPDQALNTDSTGTTFHGLCTNDAGLTTTAADLQVKLDKTPPNVALSVTAGTAGANGWYTSDVTVHTSGTDATSGIATCAADQSQATETTGVAFNGSCKNGAGLTGYASPLTVKLDKSGPTGVSSSVIAGNVGLNGWYTSDVTVHTTGTDSISSPVTCTADAIQSTETTGTDLHGSCTNDAGLSTPAAALIVKLDKSAPVVALSVTGGTAGTNGWYTSDVTVHTSGTDGISGITSCDADQLQTAETTGVPFNGSCTNGAGLTGHATSLNVKLDKTGPTGVISTVSSGTPGTNGWYTSDVTVHTTGADLVSAPVTCTADAVQGTETAGSDLHGSCTNDAGLTTQAPALIVKLDKTPPSAALSVTAGTPGANGWYTSDVTVHASGTDSISSPVVCTPDQFQATETAGATFNGSCKNDAGLSANAAQLIVKLDKTGPTAALSVVAGTLGNNGWYRSDVTIRASGSDSISNPTICTTDQTLTTDTTGQAFNGYCTNEAGLKTDAASLNVKRDVTPPVINITAPANNGVYILNGTVASNYGCTDATSGVASCSGPMPSGSNFSTNPVSAHSFTVNATDQAGNPATLVYNYTVQYAAGGICLGDAAHLILQPINADGSSAFNSKSTSPAKFRVCDANGVSIGTPGVVASFRLVGISAGLGPNAIDEAVISTNPDNAFRWDPSAQQWIFNINNKSLGPANQTYYFQITLNDGSGIPFRYGLK